MKPDYIYTAIYLCQSDHFLYIIVNATVHIAQLQPPSAIVRVGTSLQMTCITTVDVAVKWNTNASGIDLNRLNTVIMHNGSGYYHQKTINNIQKELNFTSVCCSYNSGHTKSNVLILKVFGKLNYLDTVYRMLNVCYILYIVSISTYQCNMQNNCTRF